MSVVLQPAGDPTGRTNYRDTVETPVGLASHGELLGADYAPLAALFPDGYAPLWGVTPGQGNVNVPKYNRMEIGDTVLFARDGEIFWGGTVAYLFHNSDLATSLWGTNDKGQTWEHMYAIDEGRTFSLPIVEMNGITGDSPANRIQGFRVLDPLKSDRLARALGADQPIHGPPTSEAEFAEAEDTLMELSDEDVTDQVGLAAQRVEQRFLRERKIPGRTGICDLCGREFMKEFLIAAHIKPRSTCTLDERRDWQNVVMLACRFGCDELYERGFIAIDEDGSIRPAEALMGNAERSYALEFVAGKHCPAWTPESEAYFAWHRANRRR